MKATRANNRKRVLSGLFASLMFCLSAALPFAPATYAQAQVQGVVEGGLNTVVQSVNINDAAAAELAAGLQGVGLARAQAIVRYREQFGPFETVDELSEVSGIGAATVERNRGAIVLN